MKLPFFFAFGSLSLVRYTYTCMHIPVFIHSHIYTLCSGYTFACVYTYCAIMVFKMVPTPASSCLQYNHGCELILSVGRGVIMKAQSHQPCPNCKLGVGNIKTFKK